MKRRIGLLLAASMFATLAILVPSSPASASTGACAGTGTATLGAGFGLPTVGVNTTTTFTFTFSAGVCVHPTPTPNVKVNVQFAAGTVKGYCGFSAGSGVAGGHHAFKFNSQGTVIVLAGGATGVVSAVSDPAALPASSCAAGTATKFLITGAVALT